MIAKRMILIVFLVIATLQVCWATPVGPVYTGSISKLTGGVTGVPGSNWMTDNPRLSWVVTWTGTSWNYAYNYSVDKPGGVSHLIIETSPTFTAQNIWGFSGFSKATIDTWTRTAQGNSNPFMPLSGIYGIKFESFNPTGQYVSIAFNSDRAPVWGDFYVKDGKVGGVDNAVWNAGFTDIDTDPLNDPANGSIAYHILRPDTHSQPNPSPNIPEATAMVLGPSGLAMIVALEKHRRRYQRLRDGMSLGYYMAKRTVDMMLAFAALLFFAPLFVLIMLLVRLDSAGPIFFKRMAVGKSGKTFGMLKFRTMIVDAEQILQADGALREEYYTNGCKLKDDPRVTRLGKFLRKTSLDELPQFINVLSGDMTFVGPRPIAEDELDMYGPAVEQFKTVTPGITGLWQTQGRSEVSYDKRVQLDMLYIEQRSLALDIWVLLCTLPAVLLKRGAF